MSNNLESFENQMDYQAEHHDHQGNHHNRDHDHQGNHHNRDHDHEDNHHHPHHHQPDQETFVEEAADPNEYTEFTDGPEIDGPDGKKKRQGKDHHSGSRLSQHKQISRPSSMAMNRPPSSSSNRPSSAQRPASVAHMQPSSSTSERPPSANKRPGSSRANNHEDESQHTHRDGVLGMIEGVIENALHKVNN